MRYIRSIVISLGALLMSGAPALAQAEDYYKPGMPGVVTSMEAFGNGHVSTAASIGLMARYALAHGDYDQAIRICYQAMRRDDEDLEIHMCFADALTHKLAAQNHKDPNLYNLAVREWLIVYRSERGIDRGLTHHGVGIPGIVHRFDDEDMQIPAKQKLIALTGRAPGDRETDEKYLKKVCVDATKSVAGTVITKETTKKENTKVSSGGGTH